MNNIIIKQKDETVSWEGIRDVLIKAHTTNRERGIIMRYPSLPASEIEDKIRTGNGKILVAIDDKKLVGVSGYQIKKSNKWYCNTTYFYMCFSGVLPEYAGNGIYKSLYLCSEKERERLGIPIMIFDTHEKNQRILKINQQNGFIKVDYLNYGDHNNVVMAKWFDKQPFSKSYIRYRFYRSVLSIKIRAFFND